MKDDRPDLQSIREAIERVDKEILAALKKLG